MKRPILLLLAGAVLRELLPHLAKLADALDPADTATSAWGPRVIVPPAWVEMEAGQ